MDKKYEVIFLDEAIEYLEDIDEKARKKLIYNIAKSSTVNDPKLFKKLTEKIWEFRALYQKKQYRLLAFWDKRDNKNTLVVGTNGFIKKTQKTPKSEIKRAEKLMDAYFENN